jgi:cellobiose-specific phosphotransferase system component IIA
MVNNTGSAQAWTSMPEAIRRFRSHGYKESRVGCEDAAEMVNVAHHAEVAILDELRAQDT